MGSGEESMTTVRETETVTVTVAEKPDSAEEATTGSAPATGAPKNLMVTSAIRERLRASFAEYLDEVEASRIEGPLPGSIYYGEYRGSKFAVAEFRTDSERKTAFFAEQQGSGLHYLPDIGGKPADLNTVPCPLRRTWGFRCSGQ